jgi:hypothetical protein
MSRGIGAMESPQDVLTQFCDDLSEPLEVLSNLVYLAIRNGPHTNDSRRYLHAADEILADVREAVLARCRRRAAWALIAERRPRPAGHRSALKGAVCPITRSQSNQSVKARSPGIRSLLLWELIPVMHPMRPWRQPSTHSNRRFQHAFEVTSLRRCAEEKNL